MNRRIYWLLSVAVGVTVGVLTYLYLTADVSLALTNAVLVGSGVGLTVRNHLALTDRYGDAYGNARNWWNAGLGPLIVVAGVFGVSPTLPVSTDLGFALVVLLVGAILVAWNLGVGGTLRMGAEQRDGS